MIARAVEKYVRMSPRKVRYVLDPLRDRTVAQALVILSSANRRACKPVAKAIAAAFANARQLDPTLSEEQVVISRLFADGGPAWKRFRAAAFGRAVNIRKETAHITVELDRAAGKTIEVERPSAPKTATPQGATRAPRGRAAGKRPARRPAAAKPKRAAAGKTTRKK